LLERKDAKAADPARGLIDSSPIAAARAQAAWLLHRFCALDEKRLLRLLHDEHPRVREQALIWCEPLLPQSSAIQERLGQMPSDPDARVRYQLTLTLGEWDDDRIVQTLSTLVLQDVNDPWFRRAIASSLGRRAGIFLDTHINLSRQSFEPTD